MPKFRVRCDNPKTDFESASLHTAKAAAKDVRFERTNRSKCGGHGRWRGKGCPHGSAETSRSAPVGLGTDGATKTAYVAARSRTFAGGP